MTADLASSDRAIDSVAWPTPPKNYRQGDRDRLPPLPLPFANLSTAANLCL
jgi:hypothetical protein